MPRLLSNKEPTRLLKSEISLNKQFKSEDKEPIRKTEKKILNEPSVPKGRALRTSSEQKSEDEMTSWEYYCFLMRFGKRKMDRYEWMTWKVKKNEEDNYKNHLRKKYNWPKEKMSAAGYSYRVYHVGDMEEVESNRQQYLCHYDNMC